MSFPIKAGGSAADRGYDITSLGDGSSIVIGVFSSAASFGDTKLTSAGNNDVIIAKLNADGSYAWAKQAGGNDTVIGLGITSLSDGTSIVTGMFQGAASFGGTTLTSSGSSDAFTAALDANGNWLSAVVLVPDPDPDPDQSNGDTDENAIEVLDAKSETKITIIGTASFIDKMIF